MNDRERFLAVANFEKPDYYPIFAFPGAPGMSRGCMQKTHERLVEGGMPAEIGGVYRLGYQAFDVESWKRYWGTTDPIFPDFGMAWGEEGFERTTRVEDGFEIIECESGAVTRQVIDNDITYIMPEYIRFPVRDRASWEFWKERMTPREFMPMDEVRERAKKFEGRTKPLCVGVNGMYGFLRGLMGPEALSVTFYDDPELIHDMVAWNAERARKYAHPLVEALKPEIIGTGDDLCYNHGMLLSPRQFEEFCAFHYREMGELARANGVPVVALDTDGNAMEFTGIIRECGVNAIYPYEVKAGNDLFALREAYPDFIFFGWLEKEVVNEGNEARIEPEIMSKVPPLLESGGYFPNGDHGIQPLVTFDNLCRFMTLLHEVTGNPEGEFPRVKV